eukprot:scaffold713_cov131-Cylindrotheca_fusiformis.AAC.25
MLHAVEWFVERKSLAELANNSWWGHYHSKQVFSKSEDFNSALSSDPPTTKFQRLRDLYVTNSVSFTFDFFGLHLFRLLLSIPTTLPSHANNDNSTTTSQTHGSKANSVRLVAINIPSYPLLQNSIHFTTMQRKRNNKVLLALSSAILIFSSHAAHRDIFEVTTEEGSLRGRRKSSNEFHDAEALAPRRFRNGAAQNHRRTQTALEQLNQRVDKIAIDTYYNPERDPNRPSVNTNALRLNKVATELYFDEEFMGGLLAEEAQMSMVSRTIVLVCRSETKL